MEDLPVAKDVFRNLVAVQFDHGIVDGEYEIICNPISKERFGQGNYFPSNNEREIRMMFIKIENHNPDDVRDFLIKFCVDEKFLTFLKTEHKIERRNDGVLDGNPSEWHIGDWSEERCLALENSHRGREAWFSLLLNHPRYLRLRSRYGYMIYNGDEFEPSSLLSTARVQAVGKALVSWGNQSKRLGSTNFRINSCFIYALSDACASIIFNDIHTITQRLEGIEASLAHTQSGALSTQHRDFAQSVQELRQIRIEHYELIQKNMLQYLKESFEGALGPISTNKDERKELEHDVFRDLIQAQIRPRIEYDNLRELIEKVRTQLSDATSRYQQQVTLELSRRSFELARESRRDSRTMRAIALITMFFLPATFVTSFFGMNFFNGIPEKPGFDGTRKYVWIYFTLAVPLTAMVLGGFYLWEHIDEKKQALEERAKEKERGVEVANGRVGKALVRSNTVGTA